jgi:hypothetical protein
VAFGEEVECNVPSFAEFGGSGIGDHDNGTSSEVWVGVEYTVFEAHGNSGRYSDRYNWRKFCKECPGSTSSVFRSMSR